jgi:hypothetical protein
VTRAEELLITGLKQLPSKPADDAKSTEKKRYSEQMSQVIAAALAEELRQRGLRGTRPGGDGEEGTSGAERRMSGGIGAKKVDVTWATEESGLLLAISVKCITGKDLKTGNYQKNLINRRGDMLGEAVTLHRRFPYAVLGGFLFFDKGAAEDNSEQRSSTFLNAHRAFRIFTGRADPAGRDEQYEAFYFGLVDATPFQSTVGFTLAGAPEKDVSLDHALDSLLRLVGPNGEIDPATSASPLLLARMKTSGAIVKTKPAAAKMPGTSLSVNISLPSEEDDDAEDSE